MPATIFDKPIFPGARIVTVEVEVSNVSGSYTNTVQDNRISASMEANSIEIDDPSVFRDKITVTSYNGSFVISCPSVEGETTARISFLKIVDDQQVISSHEYDELNNNIGDLEDLETTDQSSVVNAINEVIDNKPDYATEMPMSDSDSTSVSQAIANIDTSLATYGAIQVTAGSKFTLVTSRVQLFGPFAYCAITVQATQAFGNSDVLAVVPSGYRPNRYTLDLMTIVRRDGAINAIFNGMCNINTNGEIKEMYSASAGQANDILTILFIYNT